MKIALFLNKDIEANIAYNLLKGELLNHEVKVYYSDAVGSSQNKPFDLRRLELFEKGFFYNELIGFINENQIQTDFEFFDASFQSFPIEKSTGVNSKEFIDTMKEFEPDLFISIRFGKIFKDDIIQIPKHGLINLHSAVLPDYRGIMGTLHAIKEGNRSIGCTLHTIPNSGIDTGEIIEIARCDVDRSQSLFGNIVQLYPLGVQLIIDTIQKLEQRVSIKTKPQYLAEGSYFSVPAQRDFDELGTKGMAVITERDYFDVIIEYILQDLSDLQKDLLSNCISDYQIEKIQEG
ncbi:formyltransferase family protein [Reichenbachiella versicolor]|uniref:formyltransferase family protein n=1 Tax=Reichenbachiella versicolor TaxID=1821036 RepID=UPI000D6E1782|nr:formyltransferase family protein [Reichenbachiella versicolor]